VPATITLPSVELTVAGHGYPVVTTLVASAAYTLALASVMPDLGVELHSTYVGHPGVETQISELALAPGFRHSATRTAAHEVLPVIVARRLCLYDHMQALQRLLADELHFAPTAIAVPDDALLAIEH
jgi:hypothetical protein